MIEPILQSIGLNEKEVRVFLATLERGEQPASVIAKYVQMPRNTARFILDRLVEKGLVKRALRANTQHYAAEEPKNLVNILEKRRVDETATIDQKILALKEVMAELESRYRPTSTKPKVTFYEGDEGLIKVYEDTLSSSETLRSLASFDSLHGILPDYFKTYFERRTKNKIHIRSIHPDTPLARENTKHDEEVARESRLVPADQYAFSPEIQIYDGKLSITSLKEKLGIIIESREIYEAMAVIFELAWIEATRLDPRHKKKV
jgi:HTH-type transcriptional regulator, sugar sensing transcriptional regulator